jgi:hypothetical protein
MQFTNPTSNKIEKDLNTNGISKDVKIEDALDHQKETTIATYIEVQDNGNPFTETLCNVKVKSFNITY